MVRLALDSRPKPVYTPSMRAAFKDWAVVVDALGRGDQIVILRKGGLQEGRGGFKPDQPGFLLFPTQFHQQRESVIPSAQARFDEIQRNLLPPGKVRLQFIAEVALALRLDSLAAANGLRGQHIWRDEIIAERFDWGRDKSIFALAVRVFRLPRPIELPMRESYGGCKSWIELDKDISIEGATPVLDDEDFEAKIDSFRNALDSHKPALASTG